MRRRERSCVNKDSKAATQQRRNLMHKFNFLTNRLLFVTYNDIEYDEIIRLRNAVSLQIQHIDKPIHLMESIPERSDKH